MVFYAACPKLRGEPRSACHFTLFTPSFDRSLEGHAHHVPKSRSLHLSTRVSSLECAVEHPIKDASPACPEPRRREEVSRPKDPNVHVSLLECAVTQNAPLSALECALTKTCSVTPLECAVTKKRWRVGGAACFSVQTFQRATFKRTYSDSARSLPYSLSLL